MLVPFVIILAQIGFETDKRGLGDIKLVMHTYIGSRLKAIGQCFHQTFIINVRD